MYQTAARIAAFLVLLSPLAGCCGGPGEDTVEAYAWSGDASGFNGCALEYLDLFHTDPLFVNSSDTFKRSDGRYVHGFYFPGGRLAIMFVTNQLQWPPSRPMSFDFSKRSDVSAWLIRDQVRRVPDSGYPHKTFEYEMLPSIPFGEHYAKMTPDELEKQPNIFRLTGTLSFEMNFCGLPNYYVDLKSTGHIPLYRDYLVFKKDLIRDWGEKKRMELIDKCMKTESTDTFRISGKFKGYWHKIWHPL